MEDLFQAIEEAVLMVEAGGCSCSSSSKADEVLSEVEAVACFESSILVTSRGQGKGKVIIGNPGIFCARSVARMVA